MREGKFRKEKEERSFSFEKIKIDELSFSTCILCLDNCLFYSKILIFS